MNQEMIKLSRQQDSVFATVDDAEPVEVRLANARPVSARESEISILDLKSKDEIGWLNSIEDPALDDALREVARDALAMRYQINRIEAVDDSFVSHGHRHLKVKTNRGDRFFNLKEPGKNVTVLDGGDRLVIRDSMGNRYEIDSMAALDSESRASLEKVM